MTEDESAVSTRFDHETVRSASRVAIAALALVGVLYLFTLLPGMDRLVPRTPVTFAAVATAVLSLAVAALLVYAAPRLASLARTSLHRAEATDHVETVAENAGGVVYWLVVLLAVLVTHAGSSAAITPVLGGLAWTYDAAFLLASLVPLVFLVTRLTVTVDPLSTIAADRIAGSPTDTDAPSGTDTDAPSETDTDAPSETDRDR